MGTYTANYSLFMPTVGEQGWGDLVNGNFSTIDTTMAGLNTRLTAVESEVNGNLSCTSVTTSGTITSTGQIVANGGVEGNVTGNVTGFLFIKGTIGTYGDAGDAEYATCAAQTINIDKNQTSTSSYNSTYVNGYSVTFGNPQKITHGVYCWRSDLTGSLPSSYKRTVSFKFEILKHKGDNFNLWDGSTRIYYKKSDASSWNYVSYTGSYVPVNTGNIGRSVTTNSINLDVNSTYYFYYNDSAAYYLSGGNVKITGTITSLTTYYVKYATP